MRRPLKLALLAVGTLVLLAVLLLWSTVRRGFSTHDEPSRLEAWVARSARHWSTPAELRDAKNPLPLTPQVMAEARAHWADHCASCHDNDGKGKTVIGEKLYPRAPDMTLAATQGLSDGELFAVIENGIRLTGMPGWGDGTAESAYGSWGLVHLIRVSPRTLGWIELILATPVVLWGGWPFFVRGWYSLVHRSLNMFTLIALGVGVAYVYSVVARVAPGLFPPSFRDEHGEVGVYFEAAAVIVTLVLLGQVMELRARSRTGAAIKALLGLAPETACRRLI